MKENTKLVLFYKGKVMNLDVPDRLLSIEYVKELFSESKDGIDLKSKLELIEEHNFEMLGFSIDNNFKKETVNHVFYISINPIDKKGK